MGRGPRVDAGWAAPRIALPTPSYAPCTVPPAPPPPTTCAQEYIENENARLDREAQFWAKEIVVRIEYKYCPNLTIIDTPGACGCVALCVWGREGGWEGRLGRWRLWRCCMRRRSSAG